MTTSAGPATTSQGPSARWSCAILVVLGCVFHLPRLFRPLGLVDACGGAYYGVFIRYYEAYGFWDLRGMPLWRQLFPSPTMAEPYLNHPPGLWWAIYALGGGEAAMRLPSIVGAIGTAVCLCLLMRRFVGAWPGMFAGLIVLGTPVFAVYCQITPDLVTAALGLTMWIATLRVLDATTGEARRKWTIVQAVCAVCGTWVDWSFGMFCFGLAALGIRDSWNTTWRALVVPAVSALGAAVTVVLWQRWGLGSPLVTTPPAPADMGFFANLGRTAGERPSLAASFDAFVHWQTHNLTWPAFACAIPGAFVLFTRNWRLGTALLVAGLTYWWLFATHAITHPQFYVYFEIFLVACAASLAGLRGRWAWPARFVLLVVAVFVWATAGMHARGNDMDFHRDIGRVLCDAAVVRDATGAPTGEKRKVATNFAPIYGYYIDDPDVVIVPPITDVAALQSVQGDRPFRYLLCLVDKPPGVAFNDRHPELEAWLLQYDKRRVPELERHLVDAGYRWDWRIREAWLIDVPQAE